MWRRGFSCISSGPEERPLWMPGRCVKPHHEQQPMKEKPHLAETLRRVHGDGGTSNNLDVQPLLSSLFPK